MILFFTHFWDLEWAWQQGLGALEGHALPTLLIIYTSPLQGRLHSGGRAPGRLLSVLTNPS